MSLTRRYYRTLPRWGKRLSRRFVAAYGKPAGLWLPNDVVNKAYDFSENGNTGTLNGGVTVASGGFGVLGQAWHFSGSGGVYISLPTFALPTTAGSLAIAFNSPGSFPGSLNQCLFSNMSPTDFGSQGFQIFVNSTNAFFICWGNGTGQNTTSSVAWSNNIPTLVVVTWDSVTLKIYSNGSLKNSVAMTQPVGAGSATRLMGGSPEGRNYIGDIYLMDAFNNALTLSQVSSLYNALRTGEPYPIFGPQISQKGYGVSSIIGSSFKFRRTLSSLGTRIGSRQVIG